MHKKNLPFYLCSIIVIGFVAKGLSLVSKIIMTRSMGLEALSLFSLVNPLLVLIITISQFSLPNVIATLIAKNPKKQKSIFISSFVLVLFLSFLLMFLLLFFAENISKNLLQNLNTLIVIKMSAFLIPLVSISSTIKGFFLGNKELYLTSFSQISEECGRLVFIILIFTLCENVSSPILASFGIVSLIIGEISQIIFYISFSDKKYHPKFMKIISEFSRKDNYEFHSILNMAIPLTSGRLIGALTYFFEPIILMYIMTNNGYNSTQVTLNYGIITGYVMPLILMPGFISLSLSNFLLPNMSSYIGKNQYEKAKKLFLKILFACLIIGGIISLIYLLFGDIILKLFFKTSQGKELVKLLAFPFIIYYVETPIAISLQALNLPKKALKSTIYSSILRILILIFATNKFHEMTIVYATLSSVYLDVTLNLIDVSRAFKRHNIKSIK